MKCYLCIITAILASLSLAFSKEGAIDYEEVIQEKIKEQESLLKPNQDNSSIERKIKELKNGEIYIEKYSPDDSWNLVDIQFTPKQGKDTFTPGKTEATYTYVATKKEFSFLSKYSGKNFRGVFSSRTKSHILTFTPPPISLKPGKTYTFSTHVKSSITDEKGPVETRYPTHLIYFRGHGKFNTHEQGLYNYKIDGTKDRKNQFGTTKELSKVLGTLITEKKIRFLFHPNNPPYYLRIGVSAQSTRVRGVRSHTITYVYKYNGKGKLNEKTKLAIQALDANPSYNKDTQPDKLKPSELIRSKTTRDGTIADGVSSLILKAELHNNKKVDFSLKSKEDGTLTPLLEGKTITLGDKHYAFALYTPPSAFDTDKKAPKALFDPKMAPKKRLKDILEYRDVVFSVGAKNSTVKETLTLKLARPPVVLIHGLASNAHDCWIVTKPNGTSMVALLEKAGLLPFTVNYQKSNGLPGNSAGSSFKGNATSLWDRVDPFRLVLRNNGSWYAKKDFEPILSLYQKRQPNRMGGIKQALEYYRKELNLAATQADVIGHSMGGILARCYVSEEYNPNYKRAENYNQGDINRLITLNTPHYGSELPHLYNALTKVYVANETWFSAFSRLGLVTYSSVYLGRPTPAVRDLTAPLNKQQQEASALTKIGSTKIPSFAIATTVDANQLSSMEFDHTLKYRQLYGTASMTFFYNRPLLDDFLRLRFQQWQDAHEDIRKGAISTTGTLITPEKPATIDAYLHTIHTSIDHNAIYWARQRDAIYREDLINYLKQATIIPFDRMDNDRTEEINAKSFSPFKKLSDATLNQIIGGDVQKLKEPHSNQDVPASTIGLIRSLIFHNDPKNDGAVRVVSQLGGLPPKSTKIIGGKEKENGIIHSYSPWHYRVQREVITLLKWENDRFEPSGFGAAGQFTPRYLPSTNLIKSKTEGEKAIRWAGIVPSHAAAYAAVADKEKCVILVRPVNRDSTKLIEEGNATKAMAIKGKSSNWGPQKGFIPVEQRFSKLWEVHKDNPELRTTQIAKYDKITQKVLGLDNPEKAGKKYVKRANLSKEGHQILCFPAAIEPDAEKAIVRFKDGKYKNATGKKDITLTSEQIKTLQPLQVLAVDEERAEPLYVTADYDLLAIGIFDETLLNNPDDFKDTPPEDVRRSKFDPIMGAVSQRQKDIIKALNDHVKTTGYDGGKVTHHGPEVQYPDSPYVDYPILVCDPGVHDVKNDQSTFIIHQGPPGFRDIHLKRYFATQIKKGYYLWSNPDSDGWLWQAHREFTIATGYDPTDALKLLPYVKEQTDPDGDEVELAKDLLELSEPISGPLREQDEFQPDKGEMTFKQLQILAEKGDTKAQIKLAYMYLQGRNTPKDEKKFRSLAKAAMDAGDINGTLLYIEALLAGFGGPQDEEKAADLLSKVWRIDNNHPQGLYLAASMYLEGLGYEKDVVTGMKYLKRSAELNYAPAFYYYGLQILRTKPKEAMEYFEKAAAQGIHQAHYELALDAETGEIGKKNLRKALEHYKRASEIEEYNHVVYYIGQIYLEGEGNVPKDEKLAIENFMAGSRINDWSCRMQLARCYTSGLAVEKDQVMAQAWYQFAIYAGVPKDTASINKHLKSLTPTQLKAAKKLSNEWKLRHP